ncbi:MAG: 2'-5' RNA ligase family protein [Mesorhizobium sp.]|uniref:2'-5' RNA ligase family protein n=1 Tax=Mesorhizobium sp. TaxID=1871066 RepID=UPI000FE3F693|nr:2'-5' RNA ligase family protein [Mesorhizobium sp.]RWJ04827.1 MAG: 2'-5' RNA ligase family protein [Mesorhizobium sp.]RWJ12021.1 MAG: 2'-5' RNA ligase family protein [Mesorhizobium sp.]
MFAITIRASGTARSFWRLVDRVSAFEQESSFRNLNYAPHLTLARYEDIDPTLLVAGLEVFKGARPITLVFDRVCVFDAEPLVLWLKPRVDSELLDIQAQLHALIGEQCSDPHYRPAVWCPHCTIASSVLSKHRSAAKAFSDEPIESFVMTFDVADALRWPPVTQIDSQRLLSRTVD